MTHKTVKKAIKESAELERLRSGEEMMPPPHYDIALCLYERDEDGSDVENPLLSFSRPQDFATNPHMKYQRFGVMRHHEKDGEEYSTCFLVHLYWDGSRGEDDACQVVLEHPTVLAYGQWQPTAPSDPLREDDFWDKKLGQPPNGFWDEDDYEDEGEPSFKDFDNFARQPYKKLNFG